VLPRQRLRFVFATGVSDRRYIITLDHLALEGTKRVRPDTIRPYGPIEAHSAFRGQNSRGQNSLRSEETDLLEGIIPRMYEVMHRVAKVSYDYVTHGRSSPDDFGKF